ncbi:pentapeptide repeat-containing protein [Kribbella soli]|uniref:Pentapeptide repeat-containing protein n=1 Tax=Kribbella soli TaxID=1124743 RepID=A0A4V2LYQ9_9ACTN|nr:pentapeptide repeat-containing protein [Kribbella soli]TCC05236.1 pentapeptide repeat-containing protein [Kribbella soli]
MDHLKNARLHGEDHRGSQAVGLRWTGSRIDGCDFGRAALRDLRIWDTKVADSSFAGADLRDAVLGSWHRKRRNEWRQVSFAGADLRGAVLIGALFDGCDFSQARLDGVQFEQCDLRDCTFAGALRDIVFDCRPRPDCPAPAPLVNLDFRATTFNGVEFWDCHPDNVVLPDDPGIFFIPNYRPAARRALAALESDPSPEAHLLRAELTNALKGPGTETGATLHNHHDYESPVLATLAHHHLTT